MKPDNFHQPTDEKKAVWSLFFRLPSLLSARHGDRLLL
jgi:hypothetical protein